MRKTLLFAVVLALVAGFASLPSAGVATSGHLKAHSSDDCPPGATNTNYCQVGPGPCVKGKGVTQMGTNGNDVENGTECDDTQRGQGGDDTERGFGGNDDQGGGDGNDRLDGGEGNDRQSGNAGNDVVGGGNGNDRMS